MTDCQARVFRRHVLFSLSRAAVSVPIHQSTYLSNDDQWSDSGSSMSDTSSDDGQEQIADASTDAMPEPERTEQIYYQFRRYRKMWRRHTGRPVRRLRRTIRHHFSKRKGGGRGVGGGNASNGVGWRPACGVAAPTPALTPRSSRSRVHSPQRAGRCGTGHPETQGAKS